MPIRTRRAAALLCVLLLIPSGCDSGQSKQVDRDSGAMTRGFACRSGTPARCVRIGTFTAYIPQGTLDLRKPIVVVDPGGPGLDPLTTASAGGVFASITNSLVLLEPWVLSPPAPDCALALDRYLTAVRLSPARRVVATAEGLAHLCSQEFAAERDFSANALAAVFADLRRRGASNVVFFGLSFGAERLARAAGRTEGVLVAPFVAPNSLKDQLRVRMMRERSALRLGTSGRGLLRDVARLLPARLPNRSVLFSPIDLDAAVSASAYDPERSRQALVRDAGSLKRGLARGGTLQKPLEWLPKAADYIEARFGHNHHYAGLVGYFGSYCTAIKHREVSPHEGELFLPRFHTVCSFLDYVPAPSGTSSASVCAVVSAKDPVASSAAAVKRRFERAGELRVDTSGHALEKEISVGLQVLREVIGFGAGDARRSEIPCR